MPSAIGGALGNLSTGALSFTVDGKQMSWDEYQKYSAEKSRTDAQQQAADRLKQLQDTWKIGFDQRQQEAETNASRAFGYRQQESERDFGQQQALGKQDFEQNRTLQGDSLASSERRDAAQIAARDRMQQSGFGQERDMAGLRSQLKQREKSEDRSAAIATFRGRR